MQRVIKACLGCEFEVGLYKPRRPRPTEKGRHYIRAHK